MGEGTGLSRQARALLGVWAFIGTGLHAGSFALLPGAERLVPIAAGIGISAGLSWLVVGMTVLAMTPCRADRAGRIAGWFDTCLIAMSIGECLLVSAAALNAAAGTLGIANEPDFMMRLHLAILIAADIVMAGVFAWRARKSGEKLITAGVLWVVVLNGSFAVFLWVLSGPLGYGG
ncbi:MAG: hypothetical protein IT436_08720 [Phycisphaerales bacterium]|nr:hypothetical protein [Phycisphaerales bacterium]